MPCLDFSNAKYQRPKFSEFKQILLKKIRNPPRLPLSLSSLSGSAFYPQPLGWVAVWRRRVDQGMS